MYPERASSYITVLPTTRSQINTFVEKFRNEMAAGVIEATKVAMQLKAMEDLIKELRSDPKVREIIMDEVDKHPEKKFGIDGALFEKAETGVKYDFTVCGSSKWNDLTKNIAELKEQLQTEEEMLKKLCLNDGIEVVDKNTGEVIKPPVRTSNTYVKITLAK